MRRLGLGLMVCALCALSGCALLPEEQQALPPPLVEMQAGASYQLGEVTRGDIAEVVQVTGVMSAYRQQALYFGSEGLHLSEFLVKAGDAVSQGQVIAQADPGDLTLQVALKENEVEIARLRCEQAQGTERQILMLELKNRRLELAALKDRLAACTLKSPMDGVVLFVDGLEPGEAIEPFRILARVADPSGLRAYAQSDSLKKVRTGMRASVALSGQVYQGEVVLSPDNVPDAADSRYRDAVLVELPDLPEGVRSGEQAVISVTLRASEDALLMPKGALRTAMGQTYVQALVDGVRKELDVEVGIETATQVEVLSGLSEGMQVILK